MKKKEIISSLILQSANDSVLEKKINMARKIKSKMYFSSECAWHTSVNFFYLGLVYFNSKMK